VLTSSGDDLTETDDPFKVAMRQIAGVFAQLEKSRLVAKLKAARDRKRATGLKVEGRKSYREIDPRKYGGEMVAMAKRLRRKSPKGGRRSLRAIADELARSGFKSESGKPFAATAVARMLGEL
jgi:DNA invertase Pin-like site-specific DNA recombinase